MTKIRKMKIVATAIAVAAFVFAVNPGNANGEPLQPQSEHPFNVAPGAEMFLRDLGFRSFIINDNCGRVTIGGEKVGGEDLAVSLTAATPDGLWGPSENFGITTHRVEMQNNLPESFEEQSDSGFDLNSGRFEITYEPYLGNTRYDISLSPRDDGTNWVLSPLSGEVTSQPCA